MILPTLIFHWLNQTLKSFCCDMGFIVSENRRSWSKWFDSDGKNFTTSGFSEWVFRSMCMANCLHPTFDGNSLEKQNARKKARESIAESASFQFPPSASIFARFNSIIAMINSPTDAHSCSLLSPQSFHHDAHVIGEHRKKQKIFLQLNFMCECESPWWLDEESSGSQL